jgi:PKD repeat protein
LILFIAFPIHGISQISVPGIPESFSIIQKKNISLPGTQLRHIQIDRLLKEDSDNGIQNRYGTIQEININLRDRSLKTEILGKGTIWQYELKTEEAFSLGILFKSFRLPKGASVFIYTPDHSNILGAFTSLNNSSLNMLSIAELKGNAAIIEYFEPDSPEYSGEIILGSVSVSYRNIYEILLSDPGPGINCPEGEDWQNEKHAVCRITFQDSYYAYFCSGFMVNNLRQDLTPYFMTASHCIGNSYSASTLIAYFNFENSECSLADADASQSLSGSTLISRSSGTDFSLLQLNSVPPSIYRAYLAGWDASKRIPLSGAGIHHPEGTAKKIVIANQPFILYNQEINWRDGIMSNPGSHWQVEFNGEAPQEGSSGSPIFDDNHRVVGQLHGGDFIKSFYGAFKSSWEYNTDIRFQLKHWLDPDNTGTITLNGKYLNPVPQAKFSINNTEVCLNNTISLTDKSSCEPGNWKWEISPAGFRFMNGTSNKSQNPEINFFQGGKYSVKLVVSNKWGADSLVKTNYIDVVNHISVGLLGVPEDKTICGCDLNSFPITATGATDYVFTFSRPEKGDVVVSSNVAKITVRENQKKYGDFNSVLRVDGSIGTCKDSDSVMLKIRMPVNDDIMDAIHLFPGSTGTFSNFCASGQTMEPFPLISECTSNSGWCPGTIYDSIQNSIWFTFVGPSSGKLSIDTKGINDRIAVYEADSFQQIISGIPSNYRIVAANDNRSSLNTSAFLENLNLSPSRKYWLQVESLDSDTGNISISLQSNSLEVFPNPSNGIFDMIISVNSDAPANISIFSSTGEMIFSEEKKISSEENHFRYNLSNYSSGLYYIKVKSDNTIFSRKILIIQ